MHKQDFHFVLVGFACLGLIVSCSEQAQQGDETVAAVPTSTQQQPSAATRSPFDVDPLMAAPSDAWPTNGGSFANQRFSPLDQINRDNVANLKAEWRVHLNGSGMETRHSAEGTPLYQDGVLYISTGDDDVFAIDVDSGEIMWEYESVFPEAMGQGCVLRLE